MKPEDFNSLVRVLKSELVNLSSTAKVGIIGHTAVALDLIEVFNKIQQSDRLIGVYATGSPTDGWNGLSKAMTKLSVDNPAIVVIASDEDKERLLAEAVPYLTAETRVLIGGFAHFEFSDATFTTEIKNAIVPSLANGYPNSLIHIYQCLKNAARLDLDGIVAEFGMFKGGATMLISRFIEKLGKSWKVYGFDSFTGFPPRRSPLDLYAHPDCVFFDELAARRMFEGRNVEIIAGDIVQTARKIKDCPVVFGLCSY